MRIIRLQFNYFCLSQVEISFQVRYSVTFWRGGSEFDEGDGMGGHAVDDIAGGGGDATEWVGLVIGDTDTTEIGRDTDEEEPADNLVEESEEDNNDVIDETEAPIEAKGRE